MARTPPGTNQTRVALVIGNSHYSGIWPDLQGEPLRDAELMQHVLTGLKFLVVYRLDADHQQMQQALQQFADELYKHPGALALVYYAGHGAQAPSPHANGWEYENFLIPVRTDFSRESDVMYEAIAQTRIEDAILSSSADAGVIILDACRDNDLNRNIKSGGLRGLGGHSTERMLIAYAASSGMRAYNTPEAVSLFTNAVAEELVRPQPMADAFYRVRRRVVEATQSPNREPQQPEIYSRLNKEIALVDDK
jgi:uncharacterized caspase-like protein